MRNLLVAGSILTASLTLSGCATTPVAPASDAAYAKLLTLKIDPSTSAQALEQRTGGRLVIFKPEAGFAVLGLDRAHSQLSAQARQGGALEDNPGAFHLTGGTLWIDGGTLWIDAKTLWIDAKTLWIDAKTLWIDGGTLWTDGQFQSMPQNTAAFQQVHLDAAQRGSAHLGAGVTVAVVDSGLDLTHPAFQGAVDTQGMHDFVDGDGQPQEVGQLGHAPYGHGTGVAGVVRQIAPNSKIMPLRVVDAQGNGDAANVASAIVWAADHGAQVLNLSLGSDEASPAVEAALAYAAGRGLYAAISSGNRDLEALDEPAASLAASPLRRSMSVSVGSVDPADLKSSFGNYGAALNLSAPGEQIAVPAPEGYVGLWSGTSFSSPMAAGALALALADRTNSADLVQAMLGSAQPIDALAGNAAYAGKLGARLDIAALLNRVTTP